MEREEVKWWERGEWEKGRENTIGQEEMRKERGKITKQNHENIRKKGDERIRTMEREK